jgi:chemotaxis protein methyltransferase CheR
MAAMIDDDPPFQDGFPFRDTPAGIPDALDPAARAGSRQGGSDTVYMLNPKLMGDMGIKQIPQPEFEELTALIARNFGINIGKNKMSLVTGRIYPMLEKYGFANHRACLEAIKGDSTGELLSELVNRISTNHTAFFREDAHFQLLRQTVLPDLIRRKTETFDRDIRIWCAACATGEEAYSILFCLRSFLFNDYDNWQAGLLATDISATALKTAANGVYSQQRLAPVPPDVLAAYFNRIDDDRFEVREEYRREITFRRLNLISGCFPFRQPFDIIFCRNVMIYFPHHLRDALMRRLRGWLAPGGYLFIGHSESLVGNCDGYDYVAPAIYRRAP